MKLRKTKLVINWVIPDVIPGSGGHRNILRAAKYLSKFGHRIRIYSNYFNLVKTSSELRDLIFREFMEFDAEFYLGTEHIKNCDALIATHWSTVKPVWDNKQVAKKLFYFVQDFEPWFFPMGNDYLEVENTYKLGLNHITSGKWCTKLLKDKYKANADYFLFPIDKKIYRKRREIKKFNKIVFFARPEMPRRCYGLGIKALAIVNKTHPEVEIILYGSKNIDSKSVPFPHTNAALLPTLEDLAKLYSSAYIGVAFSTTNPSLVPFEMMACGLAVVDFNYNDSELNYGGKDNALLVGTTHEEIAQGIISLIEDPVKCKKIAKNGMKYVKTLPDEKGTVKRIEGLILKEFD